MEHSKTRKNIAVVGGGYWGQNLVRNFAELGSLHTICDGDEQTLSRLGQMYPGARLEAQFERVLHNGGIDAIVIATPASCHYEMAKAVLNAGKDVFVEKPLSLRVAEGEELVKLAGEKSRILMVGHLLLYHPAIVKLKELVYSGELGKLNHVYSNRLNWGKFRTEENVLWSFAPHDISVILQLLNEVPFKLACTGGYYLNKNIADVTVTTMSFEGGIDAHIFVSWLHPTKEQKLVVVGEKRIAVFEDTRPTDKLLLYERRVAGKGGTSASGKLEVSPVVFTYEEPLKLECQHFLDCLVSRQTPKTNGRDGLQVLRVLDACQRSLEGQGMPIYLANKGYFVHPTSFIEEPSVIGEGTRVWHFSHVMGNVRIGKNCTLGQNVFIGKHVAIGDNVKVQNNVSLFDGVILEDNVFCGPSSVFTNVKIPRSHISQKRKFVRTQVKEGATIGANATIVCGNTIGRYSFIGAGAVVTKEVPDYALVYGNPARIKAWVCECGARLNFGGAEKATCECGKQYKILKTDDIARVRRTES